MKFAYADPPYPGQAKKHYGKRGDPFQGKVEEVSYPDLIGKLNGDYPDGWALSMGSVHLRAILPLCPEESRVMAWVKPHSFGIPQAFPFCGWEPVILVGGRKVRSSPERMRLGIYQPRDWISAVAGADNGKKGVPKGFVGAKPKEFCYWLFSCLGALPGDILDDLYPGTGAVGRAWESYMRKVQLRPLSEFA